jgi:hypothetical protein
MIEVKGNKKEKSEKLNFYRKIFLVILFIYINQNFKRKGKTKKKLIKYLFLVPI